MRQGAFAWRIALVAFHSAAAQRPTYPAAPGKHNACASENIVLCRTTHKHYVVIRTSAMVSDAQALWFFPT